MSLTPETQNGKYVDNRLMRECVVAPWVNSGSIGASYSPSPGNGAPAGARGGGRGSDGGNGDQGGVGSVLSSPVVLALFFGAAVMTIFS
jgi:hypothetical protein